MTDAPTPKTPDSKRQRAGRSPSYPSITIKRAIEQAQALYEAEGKYSVPMASAFAAWGFGGKSSGARSTRAAMGYFGLLHVEGDSETGKVKLSEEALRIILDKREDETEKKAIIRKLALEPAVHKKLLAKFPDGIKSEPTVAHYLVFEEGFNETAAKEVIAEFKGTADYAGLYKPDTTSGKGDAEGEPPAADPLADDAALKAAASAAAAAAAAAASQGKQVATMTGERIVFTEEGQPSQYLKLIASGDVDDVLLEALEDFVKRQRKRLGIVTDGKKEGATN